MIDMKNCTPLWRSIFWSKHVEAKKESKHVILGAFLKVEMKKCALLWCEAHLEVFWNLRCWKSACRCGAKHIWKSKVARMSFSDDFVEGEMWKKCKAVWREADFQLKMNERPQLGAAFGSWDVEKVHAVVAQSTLKMLKLPFFGSAYIEKVPCGVKHMSMNVQSLRFGPFFWRFDGDSRSKSCTPLWCEAQFGRQKC